jgi:tetratricopeptide (TPR) repeat protein
MRAIAVVAVMVAANAAAADPKLKSQPGGDKYAKAAGEAFAAASEADAKGDLATALGLYEKAYAISPHPNCVFNIGDVQRRLGKLPGAIKSYETYLALSPNAGDRKDVEALIDKLAHVPGKLLVFTGPASDPNSVDFKNAYILVDGEIKVKPGGAKLQAVTELGGQMAVAVEAIGGPNHMVEIVSAITYGSQHCNSGPGERALCPLRAKPRVDGRVVVGSLLYGVKVLVDPKADSRLNMRFDLPPGPQRLLARDRNFECPPIPVAVPKNGDVAYLWIGTTDFERESCRALDVKQRDLHFDP